MDDSCGVRGREGLEEISCEGVKVGRGQGPATQPRLQGFPLDEVHGKVEKLSGLAGLVHADNRGMPEPCQDPGLPNEPLDRHSRGALREQHLEGNRAIQHGVPGEKDHAGAPTPQLALDVELRRQCLSHPVNQHDDSRCQRGFLGHHPSGFTSRDRPRRRCAGRMPSPE